MPGLRVTPLLRPAALGIALSLWGSADGRGQQTLGAAAAQARAVWLVHDITALLAESDTVRLQLPGVPRSASLTPGQAARLLLRYLEGSQEVEFELTAIRDASADHGYAEARRRYVVRGTTDEREETVFLGFRLVDGTWRLREVRVVP